MSEMGDLKFTTAGDYMMSEAKLPEGRMTLEEWARTKKYVIVTAISSHRMRYCIPVDELQKLNTDVPVEGNEIEWAQDCVAMQEIKEFSQMHIGEQIIDGEIVSEEKMLEIFDRDNDYLNSWTKDYKVHWVRNWKENYDTGTQETYHDYISRMYKEDKQNGV